MGPIDAQSIEGSKYANKNRGRPFDRKTKKTVSL